MDSIFNQIPYFITACFAIISIKETITNDTNTTISNLVLLLIAFSIIAIIDAIKFSIKNAIIHNCELT